MDFTGASLLFATLASFLLFVNQGGVLGYNSLPTITMAITTTTLLPVLIWSQIKSANPVLDFSLFKNRQYIFAFLVLIFHYLAHGAIILIAPFFFIKVLSFSPIKMGLFLAAFYAGRTVLAPISGQLSDLFGPRLFLVFGNLLLALALFWTSLGSTDGSEWVLLSGLLMAGAGSACFEPVATSAIMGAVPIDRLGIASASVAMGRHVAFAIGVAISGAIFTMRERVYLANTTLKDVVSDIITKDAISGGFANALLVSVVLALAAAAFSFGTANRKDISLL